MPTYVFSGFNSDHLGFGTIAPNLRPAQVVITTDGPNPVLSYTESLTEGFYEDYTAYNLALPDNAGITVLGASFAYALPIDPTSTFPAFSCLVVSFEIEPGVTSDVMLLQTSYGYFHFALSGPALDADNMDAYRDAFALNPVTTGPFAPDTDFYIEGPAQFTEIPDTPQTVRGTLADENLIGGGSDDIIYGGGGLDVFVAGAGNDTIFGGDASNADTLNSNGIPEGDTFYGGLGDDHMVATTGYSRFWSDAGADTMDGSAGENDAVVYLRNSGEGLVGVNVHLGRGTGQGGHAEGDRLIGIENLGGSIGDDTLTGSWRDNIIFGFAGDDTIYGLGGDDHLTAGGSNSRLVGGSGNDALFAENHEGTMILLGGHGDDRLFSGMGGDKIYGGAGHDWLISNDEGFGIDYLYGGAGNDRLDGEAVGGRLYGGAGNDTLNSNGDKKLYGGNGEDVLLSSGAGDALFGGSGNDVLSSEGGSVILHTGSLGLGGSFIYGGGDSLFGGSGDDEIYGYSDEGILRGGSGNDVIYGGRDARLIGDSGDDILEGGAILFGGSGNDRLVTAAEAKMTGGAGADVFVFEYDAGADYGNTSRVFDFEQGVDQIEISTWGIADFETLHAGMSDRSFGLYVELDDYTAIMIKGMSVDSIVAGDFIL